MPLRKTRLKNSNLYLILDRDVLDYTQLFSVAKQAIRWGVDIIQLRDKQSCAKEMLQFSRSLVKLARGKALFIVNDRVDIAKMSEADGVHVGQDDLPVAAARKILGARAVIGTSCQSLKHARQAAKDQVDYIGFGSIFKTLTKPDRNPMDLKVLKSVLSAGTVPVFCIGGINLQNIEEIFPAGCRRVAVCRDILLSRDVRKTVEGYKQRLSALP